MKKKARKLSVSKETLWHLASGAGPTINPPYTEWQGCFPTAICTYTCPVQSVCYTCNTEPEL